MPNDQAHDPKHQPAGQRTKPQSVKLILSEDAAADLRALQQNAKALPRQRADAAALLLMHEERLGLVATARQARIGTKRLTKLIKAVTSGGVLAVRMLPGQGGVPNRPDLDDKVIIELRRTRDDPTATARQRADAAALVMMYDQALSAGTTAERAHIGSARLARLLDAAMGGGDQAVRQLPGGAPRKSRRTSRPRP